MQPLAPSGISSPFLAAAGRYASGISVEISKEDIKPVFLRLDSELAKDKK